MSWQLRPHCSNGFTVTMWLRTSSQSGDKYFLSSGAQSEISHGICVYKKDSRVGATFQLSSGETWLAASGFVMNPTTWYHVAVTWSLTSSLNVYVDGGLEFQQNIAANLNTGNSQSNLTLGRPNNDGESDGGTAYAYYADMRIYYEEKSAAFIMNML